MPAGAAHILRTKERAKGLATAGKARVSKGVENKKVRVGRQEGRLAVGKPLKAHFCMEMSRTIRLPSREKTL